MGLGSKAGFGGRRAPGGVSAREVPLPRWNLRRGGRCSRPGAGRGCRMCRENTSPARQNANGIGPCAQRGCVTATRQTRNLLRIVVFTSWGRCRLPARRLEKRRPAESRKRGIPPLASGAVPASAVPRARPIRHCARSFRLRLWRRCPIRPHERRSRPTPRTGGAPVGRAGIPRSSRRRERMGRCGGAGGTWKAGRFRPYCTLSAIRTSAARAE